MDASQDARLREVLETIGASPRLPLQDLRGTLSGNELKTLHDRGWIECTADSPLGTFDPLDSALANRGKALLFAGDSPIYCRLTPEGRTRLAINGSRMGRTLARAKARGAESADPPTPPLTVPETNVLAIIRQNPKGIMGQAICDELSKKEKSGGGYVPQRMSLSTLTRHIIPPLKAYHGVRNRRGAGYYDARP